MKRKADAPRRDVVAEVTDRIVAALEAGTAPWVKPWRDGEPNTPLGMPVNAHSGRPYSGCNILLLWASGYSDPRWMTFKQALARGGCVRKGEHGTPIVYWSFVVRDEEDGPKKIAFAKAFTVFNVEQIDGLDIGAPPAVEPSTGTVADELAEHVGARVTRRGSRACYNRGTDAISMPPTKAFRSVAEYEATLLHELTHWTGHPTRADRQFGKRFGDDAYAMEELVAELGAAFLCARLGVEGQLQHASYIDSWIRVLKADKHAVFTAARQASTAMDILLANTVEETADEAAEAAAA